MGLRQNEIAAVEQRKGMFWILYLGMDAAPKGKYPMDTLDGHLIYLKIFALDFSLLFHPIRPCIV